MGGDRAPVETVAGAVDASQRGVDVVLVGDTDTLSAELENHDVRLPIVHAPDVVGMGDDPASALREKPESSIVVAARLVSEGNADGFISAGSTGAAMAAAAIIVGRIKSVSRPPIASLFPTPGSPTLVLDAGANPDVNAEQLAQFAVMGSVAASALWGMEDPRVGLISNGEEKGKGRDLERAAYELLEAGPTNFVGNVEGRDLSTDRVDVMVTDGFTGNIVLKTTEGAAAVVSHYLLQELDKLPSEVQDQVMPAFGRVKAILDYETYGGAFLLGVKGLVLIAHGASSRTAICNALVMARDGADQDLAERIAAKLGA
jgi:glycerol-3-phosphate acyltransferase PlsX